VITFAAMCCGVAVYAQLMKKVQYIARVISIDPETPQQVGLRFVRVGE